MASPQIQWQLTGVGLPGPDTLFKINRPDLGMVGAGVSFDQLMTRLEAYRKANAIPIGLEFRQEVVNAICDMNHAQWPEICATDDPNAPLKPVYLSTRDVITGTNVMLRFAASGFKVVDLAEAERRATICSNCRFNVNFSKSCGGGLCGELLGVVQSVAPQPTSKDAQIESCFICHCLLKASVWIPLETQIPPMPAMTKAKFEAQAPWCWKRPSLLDPDSHT